MGTEGHLLLVNFHAPASQVVVAYKKQIDAHQHSTSLLLLNVGRGSLSVQGPADRPGILTSCIRALPLQPDTFVSGGIGVHHVTHAIMSICHSPPVVSAPTQRTRLAITMPARRTS